MAVHECVSFILLRGSKLLLEKRSNTKETDPGLITIPGGHIEKGETKIQALVRELEEELCIVPIDSEYLCSLYHPTTELQLIHYFIVKDWKGDISVQEADDVGWYTITGAPVGIDADRVALSELQRVNKYL
ncbi:NUDIX hydrolase [Vibrio variabilis]|uniref:NUDIX hydrolase n=1 Tax=Vibrio variabilis TaxID=990271 RepID=UPI000DD59F7F|nr:NUDIX domain-containing protein [Vibrio variabilis]